MTTINLRDFYPWYTSDEFIEVADAVAEELLAAKRYEKAHRRRVYRNKSQYSLDCDDGIENEACLSILSPYEEYERQLTRCQLCCALNSLPETQGRRIDAYYIIGISQKAIAESEGVTESAVNDAISRGLRSMKKYLKTIL